MITEKSTKYMSRAFKSTKYAFSEIPEGNFRKDYGIYIHVPFCFSKCSFCPFYKTLFSEENKKRYLEALSCEIGLKNFSGKADWLYIGGGTPNTLSIEEISYITGKIKDKASIKSMGIELLPAILDKNYLDGLKDTGFTKISIGIESLTDNVIDSSGRKTTGFKDICDLISYSMDLGLWVNTDMMTGLPGQGYDSFISDIDLLKKARPQQITIYPFMRLNRLNAKPGYDEKRQFESIEEANDLLVSEGYKRVGIWTFAFGDDVYDSSRDELVRDYMGLGPAAFSTYGDWKVVNPALEAYLKNFSSGLRKGFIAKKDSSTDNWRMFSRMLYDMECRSRKSFPAYIKIFVMILKMAGYARKGTLTYKGKMFVHAITKTVVESLPYPLQNPQNVTNYEEYQDYFKDIKKKTVIQS